MVISKKPVQFLLASMFALMTFVSNANPVNDTIAESAEVIHKELHGEEGKGDLKSEIKTFINHHLEDSHDFHLFSYNDDQGVEHHIGFPLPIILWDGGLHIFSSSKFHHGEAVAESNGNFYKIHHSKIYKVEGTAGEIMMDEHHHATNAKPLDFSITKSVLGIFLIAILMFFLFSNLAKSYAKNGGISKGVGRIFEPLVLYIRDEMAIPNIGKNYKKYMSYLLTVFFFIFFLNLLGLTPFGFNITGNIAITFSLAIITYLITTFSANKNYWTHMLWMPGVPVLLKPFLALIELLGTIIKPFSLMIRLYANMLAGHVVLMSIIGLMFIFKSWIGSPLSFALAFCLAILELLVAFLQAYIFTMLTALYFGAGNEEHHHEEAH